MPFSGIRMVSYHLNAADQEALVHQSLLYIYQDILNQKKGDNNLYDIMWSIGCNFSI